MDNNETRASRFEKVVAIYGDDEPDTNLIDLLTDARHWCDLNGQSFWELDRRAHQHYLAELNDEQTEERKLP
jgi:hypothetical protein